MQKRQIKGVRQPRFKKIIGIDPGAENRTGFAIYCIECKQFLLLSNCFAPEIGEIAKYYGCDLAVLEDANQDPNMTSLANRVKKKQLSINNALKQANDLGKNMQIARTIKKALTNYGVPVVHIKPSERQRADKKHKTLGAFASVRQYTMPTKTTMAQFEKLTSYGGSSSEHSRDAATMLIGKESFYWEKRLETQNLK